jgi:hypothetical protein
MVVDRKKFDLVDYKIAAFVRENVHLGMLEEHRDAVLGSGGRDPPPTGLGVE